MTPGRKTELKRWITPGGLAGEHMAEMLDEIERLVSIIRSDHRARPVRASREWSGRCGACDWNFERAVWAHWWPTEEAFLAAHAEHVEALINGVAS